MSVPLPEHDGEATAPPWDKTHPGFKIVCAECGSDHVYVESDCGYSCPSGGWGSVTLKCNGCGASVDIYDNM